MKIKIVVASVIVAFTLSTINYFLNLSSIIPPFASYFVIGFLCAWLSSFWVTKKGSSSKGSGKAHKPGNPINGGSKETGSVKWFSASKGFGFITRDSGEDIFVHFRSILGKGHRILQEDQRVQFTVTQGDKGLQAEEVSPI